MGYYVEGSSITIGEPEKLAEQCVRLAGRFFSKTVSRIIDHKIGSHIENRVADQVQMIVNDKVAVSAVQGMIELLPFGLYSVLLSTSEGQDDYWLIMCVDIDALGQFRPRQQVVRCYGVHIDSAVKRALQEFMATAP